MVGKMRDTALSELIGFILIIAILVIMAALYMTYVVPTQGRDNEIEHMQEIEKFFIDFKMNMDSLWLNNQIGVPMNSIVTLGTKGPNTGGSFSVFPLLEPAGSAGTLSISSDDTFKLEVDGIFIDKYGTSTLEDVGTTTIVESNTDLIFYYTTPTPLAARHPAVFYSTQNDWWAKFQLKNTPYVSDVEQYVNGSINVTKNKEYDLTVTVNKSGVQVAEDWVVYSNVSPGSIYYLNLLDEIYGLNADVKFPFIVNTTEGSPVSRSGKGYLSKTQNESYPIGQVRFDSHNHYWVDQTYEYRLDGIFLEQEGTSLPKINPGLKIQKTRLPDGRIIPEVYLTIFSIVSPSVNISSSDPVQISAQIINQSSNVIRSDDISKIKPNARDITFAIYSNQSNPAMFKNSINQTLNQLIPLQYLKDGNVTISNLSDGTVDNGVVVTIFGPSRNDPGKTELDCYLELKHVNARVGVESYAPTTF